MGISPFFMLGRVVGTCQTNTEHNFHKIFLGGLEVRL
jgi:hypothetical protein